ncbi:protein of unknown function [Thauera humireducens]|nr:protein of unknown function [Thauera humireducens]
MNTWPLPYQGSALPLSYKGAENSTSGAGEGNRTLVVSLEGFCSTIELHPRLPLQNKPQSIHYNRHANRAMCAPDVKYYWWREKDSNLRRLSRQIYSLIPLTAWVSLHAGSPAL